MATDNSPMIFLTNARLIGVRMVKINADRPVVLSKGGTIEFICTVSMGALKDKKRAAAKVLLKASGINKLNSAVAPEKDFTIEVECRGTYEWPNEVDGHHFKSLDFTHIICQPIYTAALIKVRELLSLIGVNGISLPFDIRSALQERTTIENEVAPNISQTASASIKKRRPKAS